MGGSITFAGLHWPTAPEGSNSRGQTFYSGPSRLHEALNTALNSQGHDAHRQSLHFLEGKAANWGVMAGLRSLSLEALIRVNHLLRQVVVRAYTPEEGLTKLTYHVDGDCNLTLSSFGNQQARETDQVIDEMLDTPMPERLGGVAHGFLDFRPLLALDVRHGFMHDDVDQEDPVALRNTIDNRANANWTQAVDAVIGLNGIARFIENGRPDDLNMAIMGIESFFHGPFSL